MLDFGFAAAAVLAIVACLRQIHLNNLQNRFMALVKPYAPISMMYAEASGKRIGLTQEEWNKFTVDQRLDRFLKFIDNATKVENPQMIRIHIAMIESGNEETLPYDIYALAASMFDAKMLHQIRTKAQENS